MTAAVIRDSCTVGPGDTDPPPLPPPPPLPFLLLLLERGHLTFHVLRMMNHENPRGWLGELVQQLNLKVFLDNNFPSSSILGGKDLSEVLFML